MQGHNINIKLHTIENKTKAYEESHNTQLSNTTSKFGILFQ